MPRSPLLVPLSATVILALGCGPTVAVPSSSSGGGEGGAAPACAPGEEVACYSGPPATEGVGACRSGVSTCAEDGAGFGPCAGEIVPAVESCATPGDESCDALECVQWAAGWAVSGLQFPLDLDVGPDGSLHLLAITEEPLAIDGAPVDVASESATFLVKLGSSGAVEHVLPTTHLHHLSVDSAGDTFLSGAPKGSVPLDLGGGELNGGGRIVIGKLGPDAQHLWSRSWGGETFSGAGDVSADPAGDVVLIGTLEGSVDFGDQVLTAHPDAHDLFVAKLNGATGATVWSRAFGGDAADLWARVAVGDDGAIHLAGEYSGTPLFVEPALPPPPSFEHRSLFVARLDPDGAPLWSRPILCSAYCSPMGVTAGGEGTTIMTLAFKGPVVVGDATFVPIETDALVVAFDAEGQVSWVKQQSGPGDQWAFAPVVNGQGDILVPFRFSPGLELGAGPLTSGEGSDLAIARFTPAGLLAWSHQLGATGPADQPILAVTPYDEVVLALSFCGDVDTGAGTLQASCAPSSDGDIAITKLGK